MARIDGAAVGKLGTINDLDDRLDAAKARLARVSALRGDPVDRSRCRIGTRFDTAMAFLDRRLGDEFIGRSLAEIIVDFGFEGRLVSFEGQQVMSLGLQRLVAELHLES